MCACPRLARDADPLRRVRPVCFEGCAGALRCGPKTATIRLHIEKSCSILLSCATRRLLFMEDQIEKSIELSAPVARVWRALTDSREFGEWFRVKMDGPFVAGEAVGGQLTFRDMSM
jgi:hypothetical protein